MKIVKEPFPGQAAVGVAYLVQTGECFCMVVGTARPPGSSFLAIHANVVLKRLPAPPTSTVFNFL